MKNVLDFIIEHWISVSGLLLLIATRLIPTEKNQDIAKRVLEILDLVIPNLKKGGGRHKIKNFIIVFVCLFAFENSYGQLNTNTRLVKFNAVQSPGSDTTSAVSTFGRMWYDQTSNKFRGMHDDGTKFTIAPTPGESTTASNGLTEVGNDVRLGGALTANTAVNLGSNNLIFSTGSTGTFRIQTSVGGPTDGITLTDDFDGNININTTGGSYLLTSTGGSFTGLHTFTPTTTTPGVNVGSLAGDPTTPTNGALWYNSTTGNLRARIGGSSISLGSGTLSTASNGLSVSGADVRLGGSNITSNTTIVPSTNWNLIWGGNANRFFNYQAWSENLNLDALTSVTLQRGNQVLSMSGTTTSLNGGTGGILNLSAASGVNLQNNTSITGTLTVSTLTSGRVPFASTAGLVTDEAALLYDATNDALTVNGVRLHARNSSTYLGNSAGNFTATGGIGANVGIGQLSLASVTSGQQNVAVGTSSLTTLTTGVANTAIGHSAMSGTNTTTVTGNTAVGYFAGTNTLFAGSNNTFIGTSAADNASTGDNNIVIGANIDKPIATGANSLALQNIIFGTNNSGTGTTISGGEIGIGNAAPTHLLTVTGNAVDKNLFLVEENGGSDAFIINETSGVIIIRMPTLPANCTGATAGTLYDNGDGIVRRCP